MHRFEIRLSGITLSPSRMEVARVSYPEGLSLHPGQAILVTKPGCQQPLRKALFPIQINQDNIVVDAPPEPNWRLGDRLDAFGPLGKGFTPPPSSNKWLLVCLSDAPDRLLALVQSGLARGAEIALYTKDLHTNLPPQVEWIPNLDDVLAWADYLAIDIPLDKLPLLRDHLALNPGIPFPFAAQVLVTQPMPCGFGACYACAVKSNRDWILSCREGPVFELNQLEI